MEIKQLTLVNFRNYSSLDISFNNRVNIFIGNNAQGKTTLLESIYLLAISKSHKTYKDKEIIRFNEAYSKVNADLYKNDSLVNLEIIISSQGKKVMINNVEKRKISEYIGVFNVVIFAPEDLDIIKGEPTNRRKFLDVEIGQISSIYIYHLNQYNKVLKQRNEYLKQISHNKQVDYAYLDILTEQLARHGEIITKKRINFIKKLNIYGNHLHKYISNFEENLTIQYKSNYHLREEEVTFDNIFNVYKNNYQKAITKGITQLGIQRDDIRFIVNNIDVSDFGSQGQQRTAALAIKLSLIDFIKEETKYYPIVLLDDVLSELDDTRQTQLLDCIKDKVQTFVTTTNISGIKSDLVDKADIFYIENAQIFKREGEHNGK
ncbi:DNA replication/repair protein RecF [Mycoplasmatota bacterium]|nr:DNA replication/repair protein RecF [Mycoplasmatota bacterium]